MNMERGNMEVPLAAPVERPVEKKEKEPITREQCLEAMKEGKFEVVGEWYARRQQETESLGHEGRLDLVLEMATLQTEAGLLEYARDTILEGIGHGDIRANLNEQQEQAYLRLRERLDL